jgi:L-glutamine-phosphate cytidylyltransferase
MDAPQTMKGIILAAGRGSRMGGVTSHAPKCLTLLGGKSLLDWQISALRGGGATELGVVCGYLGELLVRPEVRYFENKDWASSNMVRSLQCAHEWLEQGTCLVSYSDIVYSPETVSALAGTPDGISLAYDPNWSPLWKRRFADPLSDAESFKADSGGYLLEIGARTQNILEIQGQYMGLLKFTPDGWREMASYLSEIGRCAVDKLDMTSTLSALVKRGVRIHTYAIQDGWYEVDTESDLRLYEREIEEGKSWLTR